MARSRGRRSGGSTGRARISGTVAGPGRRELSRRKKLVFSCIAVTGAFLALESALWAIGVNPDRKVFDPYAGFTSRTPHFRVEADAEGREMVVVVPSKRGVLNEQRFPRRKAPGTYRIVCLGGSTTYGRPFFDPTSYPGRLRALLPEVDASHAWEVVNAGAISYASYRIRGLAEELAEYEPDLFIIDVGHNEFLERRTYAGVFRTPRPLREAAGLVGRTRVGTELERLLKVTGLLGSSTFARSTGLVEEVRRVPVFAVGPEAYDRDEEFRREVAVHLESSLEAMIDAAEGVGADVLLIAPASNLRDFAPFKSEHADGLPPDRLRAWTELYERGIALQKAGDHAGAVTALEAAGAIDDRFANLAFLLGRSQLALGRTEAARASFEKAREEDVCPFRAVEEVEAVVRRVAERRGAMLVDGEAAADRAAKHGIPGDDLFCDHVHFQPAGARATALAVLERLRGAGIVEGASSRDEAAIARAEARVREAMDGPRYARELYALSGLLDSLGQVEQALGRVREGLELNGGDVEGFRLEGFYEAKLGRLDAAIESYRRALSLDPRSVPALEGLGGALLDRGDAGGALGPLTEASRLRPDSASILNLLGVAHAMLGRGESSVAILRAALALAPAEPAIHRNLGMAEEGRGNLERTLVHYRAALRLNPSDPASIAALARGLERR